MKRYLSLLVALLFLTSMFAVDARHSYNKISGNTVVAADTTAALPTQSAQPALPYNFDLDEITSAGLVVFPGTQTFNVVVNGQKGSATVEIQSYDRTTKTGKYVIDGTFYSFTNIPQYTYHDGWQDVKIGNSIVKMRATYESYWDPQYDPYGWNYYQQLEITKDPKLLGQPSPQPTLPTQPAQPVPSNPGTLVIDLDNGGHSIQLTDGVFTDATYVINGEKVAGKVGVDYNAASKQGTYIIGTAKVILSDVDYKDPKWESNPKSWTEVKLGKSVIYAAGSMVKLSWHPNDVIVMLNLRKTNPGTPVVTQPPTTQTYDREFNLDELYPGGWRDFDSREGNYLIINNGERTIIHLTSLGYDRATQTGKYRISDYNGDKEYAFTGQKEFSLDKFTPVRIGRGVVLIGAYRDGETYDVKTRGVVYAQNLFITKEQTISKPVVPKPVDPSYNQDLSTVKVTQVSLVPATLFAQKYPQYSESFAHDVKYRDSKCRAIVTFTNTGKTAVTDEQPGYLTQFGLNIDRDDPSGTDPSLGHGDMFSIASSSGNIVTIASGESVNVFVYESPGAKTGECYAQEGDTLYANVLHYAIDSKGIPHLADTFNTKVTMQNTFPGGRIINSLPGQTQPPEPIYPNAEMVIDLTNYHEMGAAFERDQMINAIFIIEGEKIPAQLGAFDYDYPTGTGTYVFGDNKLRLKNANGYDTTLIPEAWTAITIGKKTIYVAVSSPGDYGYTLEKPRPVVNLQFRTSLDGLGQTPVKPKPVPTEPKPKGPQYADYKIDLTALGSTIIYTPSTIGIFDGKEVYYARLESKSINDRSILLSVEGKEITLNLNEPYFLGSVDSRGFYLTLIGAEDYKAALDFTVKLIDKNTVVPADPVMNIEDMRKELKTLREELDETKRELAKTKEDVSTLRKIVNQIKSWFGGWFSKDDVIRE